MLHLYRNCSLGTGDIDLVIHLNWWNTDNAEKLQAALNSQGLEKIRTFGHLNSVGYQEAWAKDDITVRLPKSKSLAPHFLKVDLFSGTFSEAKNKVFTSLWIQGEPSTCSYPVKSIRKDDIHYIPFHGTLFSGSSSGGAM